MRLSGIRCFLPLISVVCGFGAALDWSPKVLTRWAAPQEGTNTFHFNSGALSGRYVYLHDEFKAPGAFLVLDLENPLSPKLATKQFITNGWRGLQIVGSKGYVVTGQNGLAVLDLSNPQAPRIEGECFLGGTLANIGITGSYAYLPDYQSGLYIVDVSNPANPIPEGLFNIPEGATKIVFAGNLAAVATGRAGILFLDITDRKRPRRVDFNNVLVRSVAVYENWIYASGEAGLVIFDISNPNAPTIVRSFPEYQGPVKVFGKTLVVMGNPRRVFDLSDPTQPALKVGSVEFPDTILGYNDGRMIGVGSSGLEIVEVAPANPNRLMELSGVRDATDISVAGRYAYVVGNFPGMKVVDLARAPELLVVGQAGSAATHIKVTGRYAYTSAPDFEIIDLERPTQPVVKSRMVGIRMGVARGHHAYLANNSGELLVVGITNRSEPQILGRLNGGFWGTLAATEGYVYGALGSGDVGIVNVQDPSRPFLTGKTPIAMTDSEFEIVARGDYIYVVGSAGFWVANVSNPHAPITVSRYPQPNPLRMTARDLQIVGDYAYVLEAYGELHVFSLTNPEIPIRIGGNANLNAKRIWTTTDTLYAVGKGGLAVCDLYEPNFGAPRMKILSALGDGQARLRIGGPAGDKVRIERTRTLGGWSSWRSLAFGEVTEDIVDLQGSFPEQFYRMVAE